MALQFVIGRAGSGKSRILYQKMIEDSDRNKTKNFVAVVPEQYSMETQKEILTLHPRKGSFNIEVTSMTRLAYTVFEEQGVRECQVMDELGKTLVIRKVLEDCKNELVIYRDKASMSGFADRMKSVISELKQYGIDRRNLAQMKKVSEQQPALKHKLNDIDVIYCAFNDYIAQKMITAEDVLNIFCKYIPESDFIKNTYFYFDGFTGFTPSQYKVIELLMKYAPEVNLAITLPEDEKDFSDYNKFELFSLSKETLFKLQQLAEQSGIEIKNTITAGAGQNPYRIRNNAELCFVEKNIFRNKKTDKFSGECRSIEIHSASNPREEAEYAASEILKLIVNEGYRYNDIAVITGDMEGYYRYLGECFDKYGIPAFIDHKRNISANPFVDGIKGAIEVVEKDFSYETVFHMVRLGFIDLDKKTADITENYVLRSGRRGYKSYSRQWEKRYKGMAEEELKIVNMGRETILNAVMPLREGLKRKQNTVLDYTYAVYQFIRSQNMQKKINDYAVMFKEEGNLSRAKEYAQVYEAVISLLDKITALMGEEQISLKEYKQIIQAGFESIKVGIIPPGLDTVMVGDIERTRLKDTKKIIFFVGVNDGIIPSGGAADGIITDSDREFLEKNNYVLAPTARENVFKQRLYLYSLLAKPVEKISITFSKSASDGSIRRKSYLINTLRNMFGELKIIDIDKRNVQLGDIVNREEALDYIAENMRDYSKSGINPILEKLCAALMQNEEDRRKIQLMVDGTFYGRREDVLDKETSRMLYGLKENIGITRLEKFAACAYSQFLSSGLKLGERRKYEIAAFDIGNLYHDAIDRYFREVQRENIPWEQLDMNKSRSIIDKCVEQVMDEYENDALSGTARNLFLKNQVRETASKTADVLVKHIKSGCFVPAEYELKVAHGRIDRVDILDKDDTVYVKVIDYKSGDKTFRISDTFMGLQMQLMVYLKDAVDYEQKQNPDKKAVPAGGLYFHIHDPYVDKPDFNKMLSDYRKEHPESKLTDEDIKIKIIDDIRYKKYRMSGMVQSDSEIVRFMDEKAFDKKGASDILPISVTKSGISSSSTVLDAETYTKFIDYVSKKAEDMQEQIIEGEISVNPVEGACTYCPYGSVCSFDRKLGDRYREVEKMSLDDIKCILNEDEDNWQNNPNS